MRTIVKVGLGALLAALMLSALASASASAEACKKTVGAKKFILCVGGEVVGSSKERLTAPFASHLKVETSAVVTLYKGEGTITCEHGSAEEGAKFFSGKGESASIGALHLVLTGCKVKSEEGNGEYCKVTEIRLPNKDGNGIFGPAAETVTLEGDGEEFSSFDVEEAKQGFFCPEPLPGEQQLKGKPECSLKEAEVEQIDKELVCTAEKSHLYTPGPQAATMSLKAIVELVSTDKGKKFSIVEGT